MSSSNRSEHDDSAAVTAYLNPLEHPLKSLIQDIRTAILTADRTITEGIKWNTASFYCHGWFATTSVRSKTGVQLVLHHGAKIRDTDTLGETIDDPSGLLTWLGKDRAIITFTDAEDFRGKRAAFTTIIKQWTRHQARLAEKES